MDQAATLKRQKELYNEYVKKQEEYNKQLMKLKAKRSKITAPYKAKKEKVKQTGGAETAKIQAEIEKLLAAKQKVEAEAEEQKQKVGKGKESDELKALRNKDAKLKSPKSIKLRAGISAITGAVASALGYLKYQNDVSATTTKEYYLEHSEHAKKFVNDTIFNIIRANNQEPEQLYGMKFDISGLSSANIMDRFKEFFDQIPTALENINPEDDPEGYKLLTEAKEMYESGELWEITEKSLFAEYPTDFSSDVTNLTLPAGIGAGLLMAAIVFAPFLRNSMKMKAVQKEIAKIEKENAAIIKEIDKKKDARTADILQKIKENEEKKAALILAESTKQIFDIELAEAKACENVDEEISKTQILGEIAYNEYLRKLAEEGIKEGISRDASGKPIKVGSPERYSAEIDKLNKKVKIIDAKLHPNSDGPNR